MTPEPAASEWLYTPTDAEVRRAVTSFEFAWKDDGAAFDRWLNARDAEAAATRTVTTRDALAALPVGSIVLDPLGACWWLAEDGWRPCAERHPGRDIPLPATVLHHGATA